MIGVSGHGRSVPALTQSVFESFVNPNQEYLKPTHFSL